MSFARAATAKCQQPSGFNNRNLLSPVSGGYKSEASAGLITFESCGGRICSGLLALTYGRPSSACIFTLSSLHGSLTVQLCPVWEDTSHAGSDFFSHCTPTQCSCVDLITSVKTPSSNKVTFCGMEGSGFSRGILKGMRFDSLRLLSH